MARTQPRNDEERIIGCLRYGSPQVVVILFIPSHDKNQKPLQNQPFWAGEAMTLFGELYRGATAFQALEGIFLTDDNTLLRDKPILIESYADRQIVEEPERLRRLLGFARHMGKETQQDSVAVVIADVLHIISNL